MTPLDGKVIETASESFDHKQFRLEKEYYDNCQGSLTREWVCEFASQNRKLNGRSVHHSMHLNHIIKAFCWQEISLISSYLRNFQLKGVLKLTLHLLLFSVCTLAIMEGIKTFLESSTVHGLSYISTTRKHARLFWILTVLAGFSTAGYLIQQSFQSWAQSPVSTTVETLPISEITFPKITVCPPRNTFTDLNYDLMLVENVSLILLKWLE